MKGFSERNPVTIAVIGLVVIVLIVLGVFYSADLPVIGGGTTYNAYFTDASGLKAGDDVEIAGVKVGTVRSIGLSGDEVHVAFRVKHAWVGNTSTASIQIKTLLGEEYLAISPLGTTSLKSPIPEARTTTPIDVADALNGLGQTVGSINTTQLAKSFSVLSQTFKNTPASVRGALDGLTALSKTISSRDTAIRRLAANADGVTGVVSTSDRRVAALVNDGGLLLQELNERSAAITSLLQGTQQLSIQLDGLVQDNTHTLGPALAQLSRVTSVLSANQANVANAIRLIGPYYTLVNNATGSGPWLDTYICGLFTPGGSPQLNSHAVRNCDPGVS